MKQPPSTPAAPGDHPGAEEISEFAEGLLPAHEADALSQHLDACAACQDVRASLATVGEQLAALPAPARIPDDVAASIETALAAEQVSRETQEAAAATPRNVRAVPRETPFTRPQLRSGRRRVGLLALAAAVVLGIGGVAVPALLSSSPEDRTQAGEEHRLREHVQSLVPAASRSDDPSLTTKQSPGTLADKAGVMPSCVREALGRGARPLAVDPRYPYEGETGYLVVLPHGPRTPDGEPEKVDAYVVDRVCVQDSTKAGKVLLHRIYPRR